MTSLNSQESSNDIWRLTDRQQSEYRSAYQEYVAQMANVEMGGAGERPVQPQPGHFMTPAPPEGGAKEGAEPDARKPYGKRPGVGGGAGGKPATAATGGGGGGGTADPDGDALDPITEEDEKAEHHGSARSVLTRKPSASSERGGAGLFAAGAAELKMKASGGGYQKLTSDDESEESDHAPLLKEGGGAAGQGGGVPASAAAAPALKGKDFLSDVTLDKKDSSDSGVRSNESSPNHSLRDEEAELSQLERGNLMELDEESLARRRAPPPAGGGALQDVRMSICSEDQCSLLASSPEESWSSRSYNLNLAPSAVAINNTNNRPRPAGPQGSTSSSTSSSTTGDVISPPVAGSTTSSSTTTTSSSTTTTATKPGPHNENVRVVHLKRGPNPGDPPEICSVSSDTVTFGEERESIL